MISLLSAVTRIACRQMTPLHLNALHASVEQASCLSARHDWVAAKLGLGPHDGQPLAGEMSGRLAYGTDTGVTFWPLPRAWTRHGGSDAEDLTRRPRRRQARRLRTV